MTRLPKYGVIGAAALLATLAVMVDGVGAPEETTEPSITLEDAWEQASFTLNNEANAMFAQLGGDQPDGDREARFGYAATLINVQPKTDANLQRATDVFESLIEADPNDDFAAYSRFLLGRIEEIHRLDPNTAKAVEIYRALLDDMPENRYAQWALPKLAALLLFDLEAPVGDRSGIIEVETRAAKLTDPASIRDTQFAIAQYYTDFEPNDEKVLEANLIAIDAGVERRAARGNVFFRTGEIARELGRYDVARQSYQNFLDTFARENRRTFVQRRFDELPDSTPAAEIPVDPAAEPAPDTQAPSDE